MSGSPTKVIVSNERKDSERKTPSRDVVSPSGNIKIEAIAPIKASIKNEQIKLKAEFTKDSPLTNQLVYNGKLKILQLKSRSSIRSVLENLITSILNSRALIGILGPLLVRPNKC